MTLIASLSARWRAQPLLLRVLLLLSFLYVAAEFAFNATLLDLAASQRFDATRLRAVELLGRALAGFGLVLILWSSYSARAAGGKPRVSLARFLAMGLIAWSTMFFGQKVLVEAFITASSGETRQAAYYAGLFRQGLGSEALEVEGLPFKAKAQRAEDKTLLVMLSPLILWDDSAQGVLRTEREALTRSAFTRLYQGNFTQTYNAYRQAGDAIEALWPTYEQASKAYYVEQQALSEQSLKLLAEAINRFLAEAYRPYELAHAELGIFLNDLAGGLRNYLKGLHSCSSESILQVQKPDCQEVEEKARKLLTQHGLAALDWRRLCEFQRNDPRYGYVTNKRGARVKNRYTAEFWINRDYAEDGRLVKTAHGAYRCSGHPGFIEIEFDKEIRGVFAAKTGGYPPHLSRAEFVNHPVSGRIIAHALYEHGIELPQSWNVDDKATYLKAAQAGLERKLLKAWDERMEQELGAAIPPLLDYPRFSTHPRTLSLLADKLPAGLEIPHFELSERGFLNQVIKPAINAQSARTLKELAAESARFAEGGALAKTGREQVRLALIPPIALSVSLFMSLVTLVKAITGLLGALLPATKGMRRLRAGLMLSLFFLIAAVPLGIENSYTKSSAYQRLSAEVSAHPAVYYSVDWTLRAEPLLYPLAASFARPLQPLFSALGITQRD